MKTCIPRFDDRDFQTILLLFPEIKAGEFRGNEFHVVPPTPGACITADNIYHDDRYWTSNIGGGEDDFSAKCTVSGRERVIELDGNGRNGNLWSAQRVSIFADLTMKKLHAFDRADFLGAFYGMAGIGREIIRKDHPQSANVAKFLTEFGKGVSTGYPWVSSAFNVFGEKVMNWNKELAPATKEIEKWALGRSDYGTAEFMKVVRAAAALLGYHDSAFTYYIGSQKRQGKNIRYALEILNEVNRAVLDDKQRQFHDDILDRAHVERNRWQEPPPEPKKPRKPKRTSEPKKTPKPPKPAQEDDWGTGDTPPKKEPAKPAPKPAETKKKAGGDDEDWGGRDANIRVQTGE